MWGYLNEKYLFWINFNWIFPLWPASAIRLETPVFAQQCKSYQTLGKWKHWSPKMGAASGGVCSRKPPAGFGVQRRDAWAHNHVTLPDTAALMRRKQSLSALMLVVAIWMSKDDSLNVLAFIAETWDSRLLDLSIQSHLIMYVCFWVYVVLFCKLCLLLHLGVLSFLLP